MHRRSSLALACRFRRPLAARASHFLDPREGTSYHDRARDLAFGVRAHEPKVRLDQCVSREPILFPKLRIDFADFPCLHCSLSARGYSPRRPAAVDRYALARDSTALARIFTGRLGGTGRRPARTSLFGRAAHRFSARRDSAVDVLLATLPRKESSSRAPESSSPGVFASPPGPGPRERPEGKSPCRGSGIDARFPCGRPGTRARAPSRARRPRCVAAPRRHPQARLHHDRSTFAWNPSPLRPSRVSLECLLLPPRSAPPTAPAELAPRPSTRSARPPTRTGVRRTFAVVSRRARVRRSTGPTLQRHPFSGPIDSAGESLHIP